MRERSHENVKYSLQININQLFRSQENPIFYLQTRSCKPKTFSLLKLVTYLKVVYDTKLCQMNAHHLELFIRIKESHPVECSNTFTKIQMQYKCVFCSAFVVHCHTCGVCIQFLDPIGSLVIIIIIRFIESDKVLTEYIGHSLQI